MNRVEMLIDLLRQHHCNADGAMSVGECIDAKRCACSCALFAVHECSHDDVEIEREIEAREREAEHRGYLAGQRDRDPT